jgi:predicted unusual protein kinase regulating ubiquinone biosynthesis (AarF/ABC1/UbiB family)
MQIAATGMSRSVYHATSAASPPPYNGVVGISLRPDRLKRYRDLARLLYKYGRVDLVTRAGLDDALGDEPPPDPDAPDPDGLPRELEKLGPAFVKLGQLLSTRGDLLPPSYLDALGRLQDQVEPISFADVERVVQGELGIRLSKGFSSFEAEPLAAASLGQVHRAALRDGRVVAVKVQRPDIRERVAEDLAVMDDIAEFLDKHAGRGGPLDFGETVREFRRTILQELDYRREAQNMLRLAENLHEFPRIVVPRPVDDYTTSRVLTMEFVAGRKVTDITPLMRQDVDGARLAADLFRAYLHQIVIDGFFHADPHPGNVFLTDDGRIALLDLGMVSRLSPVRQDQLLKLLLAVGEGNGDKAAELALEIGEPRGPVDDAALRRQIQELVAHYQDAPLAQIQVGRVMLEITRAAAAFGIRLPAEMTLLGKTLLNLDEVGRTLAPDFDVNAALRSEAGILMQQRMWRSATPANLFTAALETKEFLEKLPGRVNKLLDAVANNDVKMKIEVLDERLFIEGLQKIANRITLGLLLAALIVGAAMLMRVETRFRLWGYPGFAMVFFLAAAGGGIWLAADILTRDRATRQR